MNDVFTPNQSPCAQSNTTAEITIYIRLQELVWCAARPIYCTLITTFRLGADRLTLKASMQFYSALTLLLM